MRLNRYTQSIIEREKPAVRFAFGMGALGIVFGIALAVLCSCSAPAPVVVEQVRTEVRWRELHDSVYVRDSMWVTLGERDTVWRDRYRYISERVTDTVRLRDSIPYEVRVEVERPLTWWERTKMEQGGRAMGAAGALLAALALLLFAKLRK